MAKEIACNGFEYRTQGGEIHRRPMMRDGLKPVDAAWLVLDKTEHYIPEIVSAHFEQAKNREAVN